MPRIETIEAVEEVITTPGEEIDTHMLAQLLAEMKERIDHLERHL